MPMRTGGNFTFRAAARGAAGRVSVYDLDSLQPVGEIPNASGVHGVAIDPKSNHGFVSSKPVIMFDSKTLATIKTIDVDGNPDGILFDPATEHIFVLSHRAPNVTVINAADGAIVGTIDLGGAPKAPATALGMFILMSRTKIISRLSMRRL